MAALLLIPGLWWGLPSALTPQDDSPLPTGALLYLVDHAPDHNTQYPAFHQLLQLPFYAAVLGGYAVAGDISGLSSTWPYGFRNPSAVFTALILVSNIMSAVMALGVLACACRFAAGSRGMWFGVLYAALCGVFVYYGRVGNVDMAYTFWFLLMLVLLWTADPVAKGATRRLMLAGFAGGLAIASKDQAAGLVVGGVLLVFGAAGPGQSYRERLRAAAIVSAAVLFAYLAGAIAPNPARWWTHVQWIVSDHVPTPIPQGWRGQIDVARLTWRGLAAVFGTPALLLAGVGAVVLWRRRQTRVLVWLAVPLVTYYGLIIATTRVVYPRFMLPVVPLMVVLLAAAADEMVRLRRRAPKMALAILAVTLLATRAVTSYAPVTYAQVADVKRALARDLPRLVPVGSPLVLSRTTGFNVPNADVYERYPLAMRSGEQLQPVSRHTQSILHPMEAKFSYYLVGSGTTGLPVYEDVVDETPDARTQTAVDRAYREFFTNTSYATDAVDGTLVRAWQYPAWVRRHVVVPVIFEFTLSRRSAPQPQRGLEETVSAVHVP